LPVLPPPKPLRSSSASIRTLTIAAPNEVSTISGEHEKDSSFGGVVSGSDFTSMEPGNPRADSSADEIRAWL
jgi:hypothetical protein